MPRLLRDLDFLTSIGLLAAGVAALATGVIADLWDLNDFWYHTLAGYVMAGFAIVHVVFNRERLVAYGRFRWRAMRERVAAASVGGARGHRQGEATGRPSAPRPPSRRQASAPVDDDALVRHLGRSMLSRRGMLGMGAGIASGLVLGRGLRPPPPIPEGSDVGVIYHEWSKPGILDAFGSVANWGQPVELYKAYPGATVPLPTANAAALDAGPPAARTIETRRSTRTFDPAAPMSIEELSRLLLLTGGITSGLHGNARRAAPSSGALYPIELYPVVQRVEGVEPAVYHYAYREHALEEVRAGSFGATIVEHGLGQEFLGECGVVVFLTQILQRMRPKYQDRSYRYGLIEAGHVGENAYLAATGMGLGACGVGAFMDDAINDLLGVDGTEEAVVYLVAVGRVPGAA